MVCAIKHYGFVMYRFHGKLMCLSKPRDVYDNSRNTCLPQNMFIFCALTSVTYKFLSKLLCLSNKGKRLTIEKTLAYYKICPFSEQQKSIMFYGTGLFAKRLFY